MEVWQFITIVSVIACCLMVVSQDRRSDKIAIVCTVKNPQNLGSWVHHHRKIGVDTFYVYIDESDKEDPKTAEECRLYGLNCQRYDLEWASSMNKEPVDPALDQPATLVFKQKAVVNDALERAARDKVAWLFHVDVDELMGPVSNDLRAVLADVPAEAETVHFGNVELLPETPFMKDCLREGNLFRTDPRRFLHYANGKAGGRPVPGVRFAGPHGFHRSEKGVDYKMPSNKLVVYHYVSCNLYEMGEKLREMGQYTSFFGEVPYHKRNMEAAAFCSDRQGDEECDEKVRARFDERMSRLPDEETIRINPFVV